MCARVALGTILASTRSMPAAPSPCRTTPQASRHHRSLLLCHPVETSPAPCPIPAQFACKVLVTARNALFSSVVCPTGIPGGMYPSHSGPGSWKALEHLSLPPCEATGAGRPSGSRHEEFQGERTRCVTRPLPRHKGSRLSCQHLLCKSTWVGAQPGEVGASQHCEGSRPVPLPWGPCPKAGSEAAGLGPGDARHGAPDQQGGCSSRLRMWGLMCQLQGQESLVVARGCLMRELCS